MHELFDRLRTGGEAAFQALQDGRVEEDLQLDFKRKASPDQPNLSGDDKSRIGEALSGFSNSAGGLLVLGVDCRNGADGVDCVQGLVPFIGPAKIASDIRSMLGSLLQPGNDGVEVAHTDSDTQPGHGYVLIWVPRSDRRPHQSRASGQFKYYKRMGRDFHPMEHYDIEDAFKRKSVPSLELMYNFQAAMTDGFDRPLVGSYVISLHNTSNVTARSPYLMLGPGGGFLGARRSFLGTPIMDNKWYVFAGECAPEIHPEQSRGIVHIELNFKWDGDLRIMGRLGDDWHMSMDYIFGCEDTPGKRGSILVRAEDIIRMMQK